MATTNVPKGAGRAAAAEKRNRHAQRTPLPPKAGQVEAAREPIAEEPKPKTPRKTGEVLAEARRTRAKKAAPVAVETPERRTQPDTKAHRARPAFEASGWDVTVQVDGDYAEMIAQRGPEVIHQAWIGGVYQPEAATYTIHDRTVKTRNLAEAIRRGGRPADAAEDEFKKVITNKAFVKKAPTAKAPVRLPFDPEHADDEEILAALLGTRVRWINRISNNEETGTITLSPKHLSIKVSPEGEKVVRFCCIATGFRAFRLPALLSVGRATRTQIAHMELSRAKAIEKGLSSAKVATKTEEDD